MLAKNYQRKLFGRYGKTRPKLNPVYKLTVNVGNSLYLFKQNCWENFSHTIKLLEKSGEKTFVEQNLCH